MRALRLLIILAILMTARQGRAGVSDPGVLGEEARQTPINRSSKDAAESVLQRGLDRMKLMSDQVRNWLVQPKPSDESTTSTETPTLAEKPSQIFGGEPAPQPSPVETTEEMKTVHEKIRDQGVTTVQKEGRKGQSDLKLSPAGVPVFPMEVKKTVKQPGGKAKVIMARLKRVPKLDIGEEPEVKRQDFLLKKFAVIPLSPKEISPLPSPMPIAPGTVAAVTSKPVNPVAPAVSLEARGLTLGKPVTKETIAAVRPTLTPAPEVKELPYRELSREAQAMLTAMILLNQGDRCASVLGILDDLSKNERYQAEANFHLATCAQKLKMRSLAFERFSSIIRSEHPDYGSRALGALVNDLTHEYEIPFSKIVRGLKNTKLISAKIADDVNFFVAKGAFREGDYQAAKLFAEKVSEASARYGQAQYLVGISLYSQGFGQRAIARLEQLRTWLKSSGKVDKNLNSISAVNLARMKFQLGQFKEALPLYMAVDKDHPTWVQGLIEQGWTQLAIDDYSGAIGNMYSLHSPYFRTVYKPESFAVRTLGYLNICQYGDAYQSLTYLENEYRPWAEAVSSYVGQKKLASDYYETVRTYLRGKSEDNVDGLPYQIIREIARQRTFLNHQTDLNLKVDEYAGVESVEPKIRSELEGLTKREKLALARFNAAKANLKKAATDKSLAANVPEWQRQARLERDIVIGLRFQRKVLQDSRRLFTALKASSQQRLDREQYNLREAAGKTLVQSVKEIAEQMKLVLENNEFLRYEVFAGSGENIRYQVSGGQVAEANRVPASIKPSKVLNWSFDGEYWEDEIGSYRSSLQNNCPEQGRMAEFFEKQSQEQRLKKEEEERTPQAAVEKGVGK